MTNARQTIDQFLLSKRMMLMLMLASMFIWTACSDDDDDTAPPPPAVNVLTVTVNGQVLNDGTTNVDRELTVEMIFSNSLNTSAFTNALSLSGPDGNVPINLTFADSDSRVTLSPQEPLDFLTTYTITIESGALGAAGGSLASTFNLSFSTVDFVLFSGGEGTQADPYRIGNADDLALINSHLDAHFVQIANINLTGAGGETGWVPIGNSEFPFTGVYDGANFSITNLEIRNEVADLINYQGLFGVVEGAEIKNMTVSATNRGVTGTLGTGILIGQLRSGTVTRCTTSGCVSGDTRTGGLIGDMESGTVHQCSSSATVAPERSRAGGLIGIVSDPNREGATVTTALITESFATGAVSSGSARVGGLIGSMNPDATVRDCYATGSVLAQNRGAAIIGWLAGNISNSYGTGNVTITDARERNDFPGFAIGELRTSGEFANIFYDAGLSLNYDGGDNVNTSGTAIDISNINCSNPTATLPGFSFGSIWNCQSGAWPRLSWQN
jgi:hypothetical protein